MNNVDELAFRLKYGTYPECLLETRNETLNFAIYNFMWDLNYQYYCNPFTEYRLSLATEETEEGMASRNNILVDIRGCEDIFKTSKENVKEHFEYWLEFAEEMYE